MNELLRTIGCRVLILAICYLGSFHTMSQANPEKHAQGMKKLAFFEGVWGADLYAKDEEGNFKVVESVDISDPDTTKLTYFQSVLGGNYYKVTAKSGINYSLYFGYDQWRDLYVMIGLEDGPGLIDVYQGNFNQRGDLVLDNSIVGTHYVQNGEKFYNRMVYTNISDGSFTWYIEQSNDGKEWERVVRYDMKK